MTRTMTTIRTIRFLVLVMLACLSNSCMVGTTALKYRPATGPQGVIMTVSTAQGSFSGELIEVRETGIVVLTNQRLRLLPYAIILSAKADQTASNYDISNR